MVAPMRFTRDIYRLLGLSSGSSEHRDERMETEAATDASNTSAPQELLSGEEGLNEEERSRRRAEKRRAKKKRQKERKRLEKGKQNENLEQEESEDVSWAPAESESEEEGPGEEQEEVGPKQEEVWPMKEVEPVPLPPPDRSSVAPPLASGSRANRQHATSEEDPEWDVSSAFVANAVSHLRPRGRSKAPRTSRENKENESRGPQTNCSNSGTKRSAYLTEKGIQLVQEGQYSQAITLFTEAIQYDPTDYRFFGNRSYCYECMEQYCPALADAETSIRLAPTWPKGYYRQGSALMGLKRYSEAEKAMEQVLLLDKDCEEAGNELFNCRVLQLMDLGFEEMQSVSLLEKYTTVHAALASAEATAVVTQETSCQIGGPSLWVGNVTAELTEKHLWDLFKTCGDIDSIRVLHERFCAFVNFKSATMASRALEKLNGYAVENTRLVVRYPDRRTQRPLPLPASLKAPPPLANAAGASGARRRGPVNGDECYFWRTTGCHFGDKCRYKHIPEQRGKDRKPWQP